MQIQNKEITTMKCTWAEMASRQTIQLALDDPNFCCIMVLALSSADINTHNT